MKLQNYQQAVARLQRARDSFTRAKVRTEASQQELAALGFVTTKAARKHIGTLEVKIERLNKRIVKQLEQFESEYGKKIADA